MPPGVDCGDPPAASGLKIHVCVCGTRLRIRKGKCVEVKREGRRRYGIRRKKRRKKKKKSLRSIQHPHWRRSAGAGRRRAARHGPSRTPLCPVHTARRIHDTRRSGAKGIARLGPGRVVVDVQGRPRGRRHDSSTLLKTEKKKKKKREILPVCRLYASLFCCFLFVV
jgi:hypothetical protein